MRHSRGVGKAVSGERCYEHIDLSLYCTVCSDANEQSHASGINATRCVEHRGIIVLGCRCGCVVLEHRGEVRTRAVGKRNHELAHTASVHTPKAILLKLITIIKAIANREKSLSYS